MENPENNIPMQGADGAREADAAQTAGTAQDTVSAQASGAAQPDARQQESAGVRNDIPMQSAGAAQAAGPEQPQPGAGAQYGQNAYRPAVEPISGVYYYVPQEKKSALPTVSMVLGIISAASVLLCCFCGHAYITAGLGIAAIICGIVGRKKGGPNKGKCTAGIVTGVIGLIFGLTVLIFSIAVAATDGYAVIRIMGPLWESAGVDMDELNRLIESGASFEEIMEWINEQLTEINGGGGTEMTRFFGGFFAGVKDFAGRLLGR